MRYLKRYLNCDQKSAVEETVMYYKDGARAVCLSGGPGTGKTFTVGAMVEEFHEMKLSIAIVASTNKALLVIKKRAQDQGWACLVEYWGTAHQGLGLVLRDDGTLLDTGRCVVHSFDVVFAEEASMLNSFIVHRLLEKTTFCVFVGDKDQAPPIGEPMSPLFMVGGPILTINMRQRDERLERLVAFMRRAIREKINFIPGELIQPFVVKDLWQWQEAITTSVDDIAIGYTNAEVKRLNVFIRRDSKDQYVDGDRIMFTKTLRRFVMGRNEMLFAANETAILEDVQRVKLDGYPMFSALARSENRQGARYRIQLEDTQDPPYLEFLRGDGCVSWRVAASVQHAHAITAHRSQGGEYKRVFVNMADFSLCQNDEERRRLLYVAFSRATDSLLIWR